ncbi:MAG: molybdopterin molybdotransferase MoeA [Burkholderiaceae bacterium]
MLQPDEALARLLAAAQPVSEILEVPLFEAVGRVLARDIVSPIAVPPMDNSQMDGYALRCADVAAVGARLPVSQRIPAGAKTLPLQAGTAARIFTGAPIPAGADAIVMQEACTAEGDAVIINQMPKAGEWIRRAGFDIASGSTVLHAGQRLSAADVGLAASVGVPTLPVFRMLRVATFFAGDELVTPGEPLPEGKIYNSNRYMLRGLLAGLGVDHIDLGIVRDTLEETRAALREAAHTADLIITSGGVSVGEEDHIKPAVEAEGALDLWSIAIKPGKPLAFGRVNRSGGHAFFLGLPGNPVSSYVTFLLCVRPFLLKLAGQTQVNAHRQPMRADFAWPKPDKRNEFLRVRTNAQGGLDLYPSQNSAVLSSCAWADGLVDNPPGRAIQAGDIVQYISLHSLLGS